MRSMNIKTYNNLPETRFKNARISLLAVLIFSFVNVFTIIFTDTYFLFSSYITSVVTATGAVFYIESGKNAIFLIATILVSVITLLPYLFCYLFGKKHNGWLIAALALFAIDTAILLIFTIEALAMGEISGIMDIVLHIYVLVTLAQGVSAGAKLKANANSGEQAEENGAQNQAVFENANQQEVAFNPEMATVSRTITLTRKKSFYGCAVKFECLIDGTKVDTLANGKTVSIQIDGNAHQLVVKGGMAVSKMLVIPEGTENFDFNVYLKMHAMESEIVVE